MDVFGTDYATPGRHLHPRLHPRVRSGARAFRCARLSARRRRLGHAQLRLRPRLLGARGDRHRQARVRRRLQGRVRRARRPGDPARSSPPPTASAQRSRWQPRFDDLRTIVTHALAWERKLSRPRSVLPAVATRLPICLKSRAGAAGEDGVAGARCVPRRETRNLVSRSRSEGECSRRYFQSLFADPHGTPGPDPAAAAGAGGRTMAALRAGVRPDGGCRHQHRARCLSDRRRDQRRLRRPESQRHRRPGAGRPP